MSFDLWFKVYFFIFIESFNTHQIFIQNNNSVKMADVLTYNSHFVPFQFFFANIKPSPRSIVNQAQTENVINMETKKGHFKAGDKIPVLNL